MKDIHIIIFSSLKVSGGGRETWLNMFLPELYKQAGDRFSVKIYYMAEENSTDLLKVVSDDHFFFVPIKSLNCKYFGGGGIC